MITPDYDILATELTFAITNDDFQLREGSAKILADELRTRLTPVPTKPMEVKLCGEVRSLSEHQSAHRSALISTLSRYAHEPSRTAVAEYALKVLEERRAKDRAIHDGNQVALVHNRLIKDEIESTMKRLGIPTTYSERDMSSRKQIKPWVTKSSGYLADITRNVRTSDGWDDEVTYARRKAKLEADLVEARRLDEFDRTKAEREAVAAATKREADMKLAKMLVRYELEPLSDWSDVLEAICDRDPRLNLAVAMYRVRCDWNDGPKPVRYALYDPVDEVDRQIVAAVEEALENWDGDGRCFRDMTWSYNEIFAAVTDQQLVQDAHIALEEVDK